MTEKEKDFDPVKRPKHYNAHPSGVECIEITRHMNFNLGNAIKYLWRHAEKGSPIQDLEKAIWYIEDEMKTRDEKSPLYPPCTLYNSDKIQAVCQQFTFNTGTAFFKILHAILSDSNREITLDLRSASTHIQAEIDRLRAMPIIIKSERVGKVIKPDVKMTLMDGSPVPDHVRIAGRDTTARRPITESRHKTANGTLFVTVAHLDDLDPNDPAEDPSQPYGTILQRTPRLPGYIPGVAEGIINDTPKPDEPASPSRTPRADAVINALRDQALSCRLFAPLDVSGSVIRDSKPDETPNEKE